MENMTEINLALDRNGNSLESKIEAALISVNTEFKGVLLAFLLDKDPKKAKDLVHEYEERINPTWVPGSAAFSDCCNRNFNGFVECTTVASDSKAYKEARAWAITDLGRKYAVPVALLALNYAAKHGISMYQILGPTSTQGSSTGTTNRYKAIKSICDGNATITNLTQMLGLCLQNTIEHIASFEKIGFVNKLPRVYKEQTKVQITELGKTFVDEFAAPMEQILSDSHGSSRLSELAASAEKLDLMKILSIYENIAVKRNPTSSKHRRVQAMEFIKDYYARNGRGPMRKDITKAIGVEPDPHLKELMLKNLITRVPNGREARFEIHRNGTQAIVTEEDRISGLEMLRPLLDEIMRRKTLYGCTTGHAYERIKHERAAEEAVKPYLKENKK